MRHRLGVSGSTILSAPAQFASLFWDDIDHIEIGEFADEAAFAAFLAMCRAESVSFGIHSPLLRSGSKYDLLESVFLDSAFAWTQVEQEAKRLKALGATYLLVHFPYFKQAVLANGRELLAQGLERLRRIQQASGLPIICEPKLGFDRSPAAIRFFLSTPPAMWSDIGLCIDVGDFLLAYPDSLDHELARWQNRIKVVHLHNVEHVAEQKYWWIPVHPSHEDDGIHYPLRRLIQQLARAPEVTFVFEHTPHSKASPAFVEEGYRWIRDLVGRASE